MTITSEMHSKSTRIFLGSVLAATLLSGSCSESDGPAGFLPHAPAPPAWPLAQDDTIAVEEWLAIGRHACR